MATPVATDQLVDVVRRFGIELGSRALHDEIPEMRDPERIPVFDVHPKNHEGERQPDIETQRTKAYIVGWELRKDHPTLPQRR